MSKLKLRSVRGTIIVEYDGREMIFPTMHDALEYIYYRRFMALVQDRPIGYHYHTIYPVDSLLPPVVEKVAKFYDLGAEII